MAAVAIGDIPLVATAPDTAGRCRRGGRTCPRGASVGGSATVSPVPGSASCCVDTRRESADSRLVAAASREPRGHVAAPPCPDWAAMTSLCRRRRRCCCCRQTTEENQFSQTL